MFATQSNSGPRRGATHRSGLRGFASGVFAVVVAALAAVAAGAPAAAAASEPLKIVATTGMLDDAARHVARERANVRSLMNEGVDPHTYKPTPGDVRAMSDADVIFYNGLHLEGRMADVIVRMASRRTVVRATEAIDESLLREPAEFEGHFDPHVWFDVSLWKPVVTHVRDALIEKDPAGKDAYTAAAGEYLALLDELHTYVRSSIATIPERNRVLVTAHDAFGYFGRAYGLELLAIQGISTDSEASLQDINALVDTLVTRKIPAVFIESTVPRKTIDALIEGCRGRGHTVRIGGELYSDALGPSGTQQGTYVGMVVHNVEQITKALGGTLPADRPARLAAYLARFEKPAEKSPATTRPPADSNEPAPAPNAPSAPSVKP